MQSPSRVSLRHVDADGLGHDLVGHLVLADDERVVVLPAGRGPVVVPRATIRAMREVPPRVVRPTSGVDDLENLLQQAWPGLQAVRMGGWTLRVGGGYSLRANSAHTTGDPGRPVAQALEGVADFYAERAVLPTVQVARRADEAPGELEAALLAGGWTPGPEALVMTADLREAPAAAGDGVVWSDRPDQGWLSLEPSSNPHRLDVLCAPDPSFGSVVADDGTGGDVVAGIRLQLVDDWAHLASLFVHDGARGAGHGRALVTGAMTRARAQQARWAALQVLASNTAALGLYRSVGFVEHHRYRYWHLGPVS